MATNKNKTLEGTEPNLPAPSKMTAADFAKLGGEQFLGKRILTLAPGEADGPFVLVEILKDQDLNPAGQSKKKKMDPVDVYVGTDAAGIRVNMPVAAAFLAKAKEANLDIGDSFAVLRTDDYTSRTWGTKAKGYAITVISRADKAKKK